MGVIDAIKDNIRTLYETDPHIHVNVIVKNPRREVLYDLPVMIKGVYPNTFLIEDRNGRVSKQYTHLYNDVITKDIEIKELTCNIEQDIDDRKKE